MKPKSIRIRVTQQDIELGTPRALALCPIARPIRRAHPQGVRISVCSGDVSINGQSVPLPIAARRFIAAFDAGKPVKPFSFTLKFK